MKNLIVNPKFDSGPNTSQDNLAVGQANGGAFTAVQSTEKAFLGTHSLKFTYGAGTAGTDAGPSWNNIPVVAGKTYTAVIWAWTAHTHGMRIMFWGGGSPNTRGTNVTTTGAWARITFTATAATTGTWNVGLFLTSSAAVAGDVVYVGAVFFAEAPAGTEFFDGDSESIGWDGAADASNGWCDLRTGRLRNQALNGSFESVTGGAPNLWSINDGTHTVRSMVTGRGGIGQAHALVTSGATDAFLQPSGSAWPVLPNTQYTLSAWYYVPVAPTTAANGGGRSLTWFGDDGTTFTQRGDFTLAVPLRIWTRISTTAVTGATATKLTPRLQGFQDGTVYWDDVMLTQGPTLWPYFDGRIKPLSYDAYSWDGTPGASTSTWRKAAVRVGANPPSNLKLGTTQISRVYKGSTLVYGDV